MYIGADPEFVPSDYMAVEAAKWSDLRIGDVVKRQVLTPPIRTESSIVTGREEKEEISFGIPRKTSYVTAVRIATSDPAYPKGQVVLFEADMSLWKTAGLVEAAYRAGSPEAWKKEASRWGIPASAYPAKKFPLGIAILVGSVAIGGVVLAAVLLAKRTPRSSGIGSIRSARTRQAR